MTPLDPRHLEPSVSLNRVIVADVPGVSHDYANHGKTGYQLVSAMALATMIRESAAALGLDPALDDDALNRAFDACLSEPRDPVAYEITEQIGRNLGYVLLTLRRGDAVNRAARPEWDESYWDHWAEIRHVWLGGGIVSGNLGPLMCSHATSVFEEAGYTDMQIRRSPYGSALPLVGMARKVPADCDVALVFDGGGTAMKRALAIFEAGTLRQLMVFPAIPTEWGDTSIDPENHVERAWWLLDRTVDIIDQTRDLASHHRNLAANMPVLASLAAYMRKGHPLAAQHGAYVQWIHITENAQALIADRLMDRWGERVPVTLEHDGTAAGIAHAGADDSRATAVIMIGTALGIGFPPDADGLRPVAETFEIEAEK